MAAHRGCSICLDTYDTASELMALPCGCTFHELCITEYCETVGKSRREIKCPLCKSHVGETEAVAVGLLASAGAHTLEEPSTAQPSTGQPSTPQTLELEEPPPGQPRRQTSSITINTDAVAADDAPVGYPVTDTAGVQPLAIADAQSLATASPRDDAPGDAAPDNDAVGDENAARPQQQPLALSRVPLEWMENKYFCSLCHNYLDQSSVRLTGKRQGIYKCTVCLTRNVQLTTAFGTWPSDSFKKLSADEQAAFMNEARKCSTASDVVVKAENLLERFEEQSNHYVNDGEWLPLGVWAARGFDATAIEMKTPKHDVMVHSVLGKVYRVPLLKTGQKASMGTRSSHSMSDAPPPCSQPARALRDGENSSSEESKDKARSRAAQEKKKSSKLMKQQQEEKKRAAALAKTEATKAAKVKLLECRETAKQAKRVCDHATKFVTKLESVLPKPREDVSHPSTILCPAVALETARTRLHGLDDMLKAARSVQKRELQLDLPEFAAVKDAITSATAACSTLKSIIRTMEGLK